MRANDRWLHTDRVLTLVRLERQSRHARFGQEDLPDVAQPFADVDVRDDYKALADEWKETNAQRVELETLAWDGVLLEEAFDAVSKSNPHTLKAALIQVAAGATAWAEAIDRRANAS